MSRINQLDALELDDEIHRIFSNKVQKILRLFTPGITEKWTPEINAGLRSLIWIFSLGSGSSSTFGQKLLDLCYVNLTRKKSMMFLVLTVLPRYLEDKYIDPNRVLLDEGERNLRNYLEKLMSILTLMNLMNLLLFLNRGSQPVILERILGISSGSIASTRPRSIGYSYMTRELLWHGLMELFTAGLPIINFHYLKRLLTKLFPSNRTLDQSIISPRMNASTLCSYCEETPVLPHHAGCHHFYCYYCIAAHFAVSNSFSCLQCGTELHSKNMKT